MKGHILLVTASEYEAKLAIKKLNKGQKAKFEERGDYLFVSLSPTLSIVAVGIGFRKTEQGFRKALEDLKPVSMVVGFGFAGGLSKTTKTGDLILPSKIIWEKEEEIPTEWLRMALASRLEKQPIRTLLTSPTLVCSPVEKAALFAATNSETVDMESAVWGAICRTEGLPWAVLRVVLDTADQSLPDSFKGLWDSFGRPKWKSVISRFLLHPSEASAALEVQSMCRESAPSLFKPLRSWIDSITNTMDIKRN